MNERVLNVLEYNYIINKIKELATCEPAKYLAQDLVPITDITEINRLLTETDDAVALIARKGLPPLGGVKDVRNSVLRAGMGGTNNLIELLNIAGLLKACRRMLDYSSGVDENTENTVSILISTLRANRSLEERIYKAIISEEEMADEASPKLYDIRKQIISKQNAIKDKLNDFIKSSRYSKAIQEPIITMRGDRYCIPVKTEYRSEVTGLVHDTSGSGQTLFIEPAFVVETNNKIRELRVQEEQEIQRILAEFSSEVADNRDILLNDLELISYIDFTFAKARLAMDMKAFRPKVNTEGYINILNGRHPMIDRHVVVPISIYLGRDFDTLVITGPNTGGKTVTLKTVGLFTLMMQSGMLVPADEGTVLSVFNGIYADIGDEQSIEQSLSTFSSHMKNIVEILNKCDHKSLILFDELGAGTDPTEGAALAMSILECVHQIGARTIATTHYSELKVFAQTTKGFANASCEFDVHSLRPTYKLLIGVPGKSNAFAISKRIGLDENIIERAKEFLTGEDIRFEDMLMSIEKNRKIIEQERYEAEQLRRECDILKKRISDERESFLKEKNEYLSKARYEAREILNRARMMSDRLLEDIRKAASAGGKEALREADKAKMSLVMLQNELDDSFADSIVNDMTDTKIPDNLKKGDTVKIISLNNKGTVLKEPDRDGNVYIQAGIMKIYIHISDLRLEEERKEKKETRSTKTNVNNKAIDIKTEIDVRGMTVEEATSVIDKQIDDALVARLGQFSIIHGKGTGALRRGIQKFLESDKRIQSFRLGVYGEGDTGVTVVSLS